MGRRITEITMHCSATKPCVDVGVDEIRSWHLARGWSDIGYHYVIRRDGRVEEGRPSDVPGAHARGHNAESLGLCLVGGVGHNGEPDANYTRQQWAAAADLVGRLVQENPGAKVIGHRAYFGVTKACPCFNAKVWWHGDAQ
jgi:hypothetical protein